MCKEPLLAEIIAQLVDVAEQEDLASAVQAADQLQLLWRQFYKERCVGGDDLLPCGGAGRQFLKLAYECLLADVAAFGLEEKAFWAVSVYEVLNLVDAEVMESLPAFVGVKVQQYAAEIEDDSPDAGLPLVQVQPFVHATVQPVKLRQSVRSTAVRSGSGHP